LIINITGQAGSGKTTIANTLVNIIENSIIIDGDELREVFVNKDYTQEGRRKNITNAYNIARFLESKGFIPIIALISPYLDLREELKSQTNVFEIYLFTSQVRGKEHFFAPEYTQPSQNFLSLNTDLEISQCIEKIKTYINYEK
jgi:adenylylsulfate kinase-like enzyme